MAESNPTCSICLEACTDSTTISCNHVFCSGCHKRHEENNSKEGSFVCPLCSIGVAVAPETGVSGDKKEVTDQLEISKEVSPKCDVCEPEIAATCRCLECEENYCKDCSVMHTKMKVCRDHTLCQLGVLNQQDKVTMPRREFCPKHIGEEIKIICKTCKNIPLCILCKISEHDSHKSRLLAEEVGEIKNALVAEFALCSVRLEQIQICTKECEALDSTINISEEEEVSMVSKQEQDLIHFLKDQELKIKQEAQNVLAGIRQAYEKIRKESDDCKKKIAMEFSDCATVQKDARQFIDTAKDSQMVQMGRSLSESLLEKSKQTFNMKKLSVQRKVFTPAGIAMQKLELRMGDTVNDIVKERMNIFVRSFGKEKPLRLLDTEPMERIEQLKKKLTKEESLLPGTVLVLKFGGRELDNYCSVKTSGISNFSIIECSSRKQISIATTATGTRMSATPNWLSLGATPATGTRMSATPNWLSLGATPERMSICVPPTYVSQNTTWMSTGTLNTEKKKRRRRRKKFSEHEYFDY